MAVLTELELRQIYESIVKPFGHPDPLGYMVRAYLTSGCDPDYIGDDDKQGFMPVSMKQVKEVLGQTTDIASAQGNIMTTLTMDRILYDLHGSIENMILAFHFGEENLPAPTSEMKSFLNEVTENRSNMENIVNPPRATVEDVFKMLEYSMTNVETNGTVTSILKKILNN